MIRVRVHPRARNDAVQGFRSDGSLKLAVTEPPEDGRANRAVTRLLADLLAVPAASVTVVGGAGSRSKLVRIEGLSEAEVRARIDAGAEGDRAD
jgi:uncharacterized protein (TIGR00251 family)